ncbi:hypothetical protein AB0F17_65660 [Nonomuraea sp. NPDC026600]|uniref:hypothetical protein n=1 Tax=Nonomuraea sp. NPDC026600 TaxID=3155363 RepID=UPI003405F3DF
MDNERGELLSELIATAEGTAGIRERVTAELGARNHLTRRFGDQHQRTYADDPNGPQVSAHDLLHYVLSGAFYPEKFGRPEPTREDWLAAVRVIRPARTDLEGLETNIIAKARAAGITWREIAAGLGLDSPQAAQKRARRLGVGVTPDSGDVRALNAYERDIIARCRSAQRYHDGHPSTAWPVGEQLAVALILGALSHLEAMGFTDPEQAIQRLQLNGMAPVGDVNFNVWLRDMRTALGYDDVEA